ncbi:ABC transporter ATP-binding protein [Imhoffiella purpurea]|uniref:ABC transporter n=1 Tax=Imhoffiella purpurea TaxID=1249627 RepID=W9VJH0_9GAMM|nr:ABC transporter ATP-binding protein [Imhoffiella purpurea]EXJ17151.1 ABC transporter [Imhoffiella purpurea]
MEFGKPARSGYLPLLMDTLVRVTDLSRRFGSQQALSDVNLCLDRGEVLGLLGPNGAGKTTCLRILSGMLAPSRGRIEIQGIDLARKPLQAKRHLGYLPERPPLHPELRVDEYLTFCARIHRLPSRRIPESVAEAKRRCGLENSGQRLIAKLSKGFRQRLGIAQAILHRPKLLILDEPTEGLDPFQMRELRALIRSLAEECGVILSSHLLGEVQAVCDRAVIMHQGRVRFDARLQPSSQCSQWRIRLTPTSDAGVLVTLPHVLSSEAIGGDRYLVELDELGTAADLSRGIVMAGLGLLELLPEHSDLERVFFDLIGVEDRT